MKAPAPVPALIADVLAKVAPEMLPVLKVYNPAIECISYMHGHPVEIVNSLIQMDQSPSKKYKKYPVFMLFEDIKEEPASIKGCYCDVNLHIVIAMDTRTEYLASERYTKTFNPILLPLCEEFIYQLDQSPHFKTPGVKNMKVKKENKLSWGKENLYGTDAAMLNDFIDAIELKIPLTLYYATSCSEVTPEPDGDRIFTGEFSKEFA